MLVVMRQGRRLRRSRASRARSRHAVEGPPDPGAQRTAIGITGNRGAVDRPVFESMPGCSR